MNGERGAASHGFGEFVLARRKPLAAILLAITLVMLYGATRVPIATRFEDFFPSNNPNVILYRQYRRHYGGAQTLVLMLRVKNGDIFNYKTLQTIQDVTRAVDRLPGVDHNEVFSLASYRLLYAKALPGALVSSPFMYPNIPRNDQELAELRNAVRTHRKEISNFVTADDKGAMIVAAFNESGMDYKALFDGVQALIKKYSDANTRFYASGAVMFAAWGYHYLPRLALIFLASVAIMLLVTFLSLGRRTGWWAPAVTGVCSAIWGLGFVGLMRFNFDPVMLVIPLILTARDLGHGIQWHGRYYDVLDHTGDHRQACARTADLMIGPGLLAVLANIAGIVFLFVGHIPVLSQIGFGGAVWLGASVAMVFVFQPILMSWLERPRLREHSWLVKTSHPDRPSAYHSMVDWLTRFPVTPGVLRGGLIVAGVAFMIFALASIRRTPLGYQVAGTPIYRPDAKVNRDTAAISRFLPTNFAWVVIETPNYPSPVSTVSVPTLRLADDMSTYLLERGDALAVLGFAEIATKPMNQLLHNGSPKYMAMPDSDLLSAELWGFFFSGTAPDEVYNFFANSPNMTNTRIQIILPDHKYSTLIRLKRDLDRFVAERLDKDPKLAKVRVRYLGGEGGLYLASDEAAPALNRANLILVLGAILIVCAIYFRSATAGILFAIAAVMANFGAFLFMINQDIGLTIDTIPVISLGLGLGINFAIYAVARIRDEVIGGAALDEAIKTSLHTTGAWVVATFFAIVGGIAPWAFSPLLFHNEMSVMLILLMAANLLVGLIIMPSYIAWRRPRFLTRYESAPEADAVRGAAQS